MWMAAMLCLHQVLLPWRRYGAWPPSRRPAGANPGRAFRGLWGPLRPGAQAEMDSPSLRKPSALRRLGTSRRLYRAPRSPSPRASLMMGKGLDPSWKLGTPFRNDSAEAKRALCLRAPHRERPCLSGKRDLWSRK